MTKALILIIKIKINRIATRFQMQVRLTQSPLFKEFQATRVIL
jgi:hypothetical protein